MLTVCSFWWTDPAVADKARYQYAPKEVYLHRAMFARCLREPHRYVCVTDRPEALAGIETVAIDRTTHVPGTRFAKLMLFRRDIAGLLGERILYTDLDSVGVCDFDPLVCRPEDLVLWRNPNFGVPRRARYNTSILLIRAGRRPEFFERFDKRVHPGELARRWGGTDQAWISHLASPDEAHWTEADGVYGAGRLGDVAEGAGSELPANARIVFFPGNRQPGMAHVQEKHPWIRQYR